MTDYLQELARAVLEGRVSLTRESADCASVQVAPAPTPPPDTPRRGGDVWWEVHLDEPVMDGTHVGQPRYSSASAAIDAALELALPSRGVHVRRCSWSRLDVSR